MINGTISKLCLCLPSFVKQIPNLNTDYRHLDLHISVAERLNAAASSRAFRDIWRWERAILNDDSSEIWGFIQGLAVGDIEGQQLANVLRLICLVSLTHGGIKASTYDQVIAKSRKLLINILTRL